jgi:site-specific DNA-methyltransferase (adenine-specific)
MRAYYNEGAITIYHADCGDVLPLLRAESVDLCCTDPPYGVVYRGRFDKKREPIVGDDNLSWLEPVFSEIYRVMKADSLGICFYGWPYAERFVHAWKRVGFRLVSHLCFVKNVPGLGHFTRSGHETAFLLAKGRPAPPTTVIGDTIDWHREHETFHPNQKPLAAITRMVNAFAPDQGLVLDPFLGSGTTLRAAKDLGLGGIGIEIEETYCAKATSRMAQGVLPFYRTNGTQLVDVELFRG